MPALSPLEIRDEPLIIGRNEACHLVLQDKKVSAAHCEVVATKQGVCLRDLTSNNGFFVGSI
ncbi:FHA domain-containing protein [Pajaroellobacter abortibovis]|uniref:FHA domain-containing protein n=1 Tax=Pajaroellobacter abortibovis TaxID=1882918 RepID=A0A1L6MVI4_9BACT|nr:FHA domain-containing protein [Pajaroellobacter abortibovis]APR99484.1 hypothetical protein BCY86_01400 [Pajaroellobacter abortibovis]